MNPLADDYYGRPECSNSDLSTINKQRQTFQIIYDQKTVQNFGTLLDCMITDPRHVDYFKLTCAGVQHTRDEFALAEKMKKVFFADPFCAHLHKHSEMQRVTIREKFKIVWRGFTFWLPFRMKADFNAAKVLKMIADLKTTNAKTLKEFMQQIKAFGYHRQGAVYLDMEGLDKFLLIGISKHPPHPIFKVAIERGDELYMAGREAYEELAFRYFTLFDGLVLDMTTTLAA